MHPVDDSSKTGLLAIERLEIALVSEDEVRQAQNALWGCEHCMSGATLAFEYLLDELLECDDPTVTEYLMCRPAVCPACSHLVHEKTFIVVY